MEAGLDLLRKIIKNHGIANGIYFLFLKIINKFVQVRVLTCVVISEVKPSALEVDSKYQHGFLQVDQLQKLSFDHENQLPEDFLQSALGKGDQCYAITDQGALASYGWYSNVETLTDIEKLKFCFDPKYIYMYKGLTKNDYRGQRLHAVGMSWALTKYLEKGFEGIVSYVESTNFDSLKSCFRMGYQEIGKICILKLFGKVFHYSSKSCRDLKIRLS